MTCDDQRLAHARDILQEIAARGTTITYRELADELDIEPPNVIQQVARLLEWSMHEDAAVGHPFLASVVISQAEGMPRRGFFELAAALGRFQGNPDGSGAREFHAREHRAAVRLWGGG